MAAPEDSILDTTKKFLGLASSDTSFDLDVILHINSVFMTLQQLGVGPKAGFAIEDKDAKWISYLLGDLNLNSVKSYMYLKVRLLFDPPATSFAIDAMQKQILEFEWRLQVQVDPIPTPIPVLETSND